MSGFGFWTPLFLGGLGLLVLPWLIHRIRRPERETVRFSSLLFIPDERHEVIERRRVQHPLLMVLRMLLLLLLAFAFARPYLLADPIAAQSTNRIHLILIDHSLSVSGSLDQARQQAGAILDELTLTDRVGLMTFGRQTELLVPISSTSDPEAGSATAVRTALDRVQPTWAGTDYVNALSSAERHLIASARGDSATAMVLHLISDFQESGMPDEGDGWRLSGTITFVPHALTSPVNNLAVSDAIVVERNGAHRLKAQIRNTAETNGSTQVRVVVDGQPVHTSAIDVSAGNARQIAVDLDLAGDRPTLGYITTGEDDLPRDNQRYIVWNPVAKPQIVVTSQTSTWVSGLIRAALPAERMEIVSQTPGARPAVVVSDRLADLDTALLDYAATGGSVLLIPDRDASADHWNRQLSDRTGITLSPYRAETATLSQVDLSHAIFAPMSGPRFNDFSAIRFNGHLPASRDADSDAIVLASFDSGQPAILEAPLGEGTIIVWLSGISPSVTNLSRSPRFVPLLQETVGYLIREEAVTSELIVEREAVPPGTHTLRSQSSGSIDLTTEDRLTAPGWLIEDESGVARAVNVDPDETDLTHIPPVEFQLRLCHGAPATAQAVEAAIIPGEDAPRVEHGYLVLLLVGCALLLENLYAARLETA